MANQTAQEELLLDVRVAEASSLYKFYLIQEKKILGAAAVILFLTAWELCRQHPATHQPHVHERAVFRVQGGFSDVCFGGDL